MNQRCALADAAIKLASTTAKGNATCWMSGRGFESAGYCWILRLATHSDVTEAATGMRLPSAPALS